MELLFGNILQLIVNSKYIQESPRPILPASPGLHTSCCNLPDGLGMQLLDIIRKDRNVGPTTINTFPVETETSTDYMIHLEENYGSLSFFRKD